MNILVTGADGFIGSHLCELLLKNDRYNVTAISCYNSFGTNGWLDYISPDAKSNLNIKSGDIRDTQFVFSMVKNADIVLHLAALIGIPYSYEASKSYIDTNVIGTHNILSAGLASNVSHIITTSTSEVYGTAQFVPITEDHPLAAQSPYSATKIAVGLT